MNKKYEGAPLRRMGRGRDALVMSVMSALVGSAFAQAQADAPPGPVPAATTATSAGAQNAPVVPTVTVSGFRSSLGLSAAEKRDNIGLSDTVFSEDMGKFPDPNIADALSRVPGVQVTRASIDGEGMNISIRGMGQPSRACC